MEGGDMTCVRALSARTWQSSRSNMEIISVVSCTAIRLCAAVSSPSHGPLEAASLSTCQAEMRCVVTCIRPEVHDRF